MWRASVLRSRWPRPGMPNRYIIPDVMYDTLPDVVSDIKRDIASDVVLYTMLTYDIIGCWLRYQVILWPTISYPIWTTISQVCTPDIVYYRRFVLWHRSTYDIMYPQRSWCLRYRSDYGIVKLRCRSFGLRCRRSYLRYRWKPDIVELRYRRKTTTS